jgi:hypothetical protein
MMIRVRCKVCSKEVGDFYGDLGCCGCHNLTSVRNGKIIAKDLTKVVIIDSPKKDNKSNKGGFLLSEDISWQESRRNRKIRKLDFEVR